MSVGPSEATANLVLQTVANLGLWAQLHLADPGLDGTDAIADEDARILVSFGTPVGGVMLNDAPVVWPTVVATEQYTYITLWDAEIGGVFRHSGGMQVLGGEVGADFTLPVGAISYVVLGLAADG